jgi:hypothetical protein
MGEIAFCWKTGDLFQSKTRKIWVNLKFKGVTTAVHRVDVVEGKALTIFRADS